MVDLIPMYATHKNFKTVLLTYGKQRKKHNKEKTILHFNSPHLMSTDD